VPYKELKIEKHFYSISEVAGMFDVNISLIRYWENIFPTLQPHKNKKGNRMFTKEDIDQVRLIYHLVKERGLTLKGAQKKLSENFEDTTNNFEVVKRLQEVRKQLTEIRDELEE
jgi:DNA-binding transcriptional MerR regulator